MEESAPALVSTSTLWPASTSAFTPEGTMPTRDSWSLTSLGTPIIIANSPLFPGVNLGPLQPVRIINVDGPPLRVKINCSKAALAVPVTRGFDAAKGQMHLRPDGRSIDVSDTRIQIAHGTKGAVHIARVNGRREAVLDAVGHLDGLVKIFTLDHAHHRTENFFLRDAHTCVNVSENCGLKEPAMLTCRIGKAFSAQLKLCPFAFADLNILRAGFNLLLVDLRSHVHGFIKAAAYLQPLRAIHQPVGKLAVQAFLNDNAAGRRAALSRGAKSPPEHAVNGQVEVGILQNNDGVLAAHLQRARLKAARRCLTNHASNFAGAGKGNGPNVGAFYDRRSRFRSEACYHIHNAFGQPGIHQGLDQVKSGEWRVFSRLDNTGIAANQSGKQLPGRNGHGEVPWADHPADPMWCADGHGKFVRQLGRHTGPE